MLDHKNIRAAAVFGFIFLNYCKLAALFIVVVTIKML